MDDLLCKIKAFLEDYAERHGEVRTDSTDRLNRAELARQMGVDKSTVSRLLRMIRHIQDPAKAPPFTLHGRTEAGLMKLARAGSRKALHDTLDRIYRLRGMDGGKKRPSRAS